MNDLHILMEGLDEESSQWNFLANNNALTYCIGIIQQVHYLIQDAARFHMTSSIHVIVQTKIWIKKQHSFLRIIKKFNKRKKIDGVLE